MRFLVPQFIDVEDKIFGPLTLKQAIYVAGGAGVVLAIFTRFGFFWAVLLGAPVGILAFALAFVKVNNRPFYLVVYAAVTYITHNKLYLWKKLPKKKEMQPEIPAAAPEQTTPSITRSKLRELAWSLDTSTTLYTNDTKT